MPQRDSKSNQVMPSKTTATLDNSAEIKIEDMRVHAGIAVRLLRALANENRLMILCRLFEDEFTVGQLNAEVDLSQSALSQHLAILRRDGLVDTRRESQTIYYSLAPGPVARIIETLHDIYCAST